MPSLLASFLSGISPEALTIMVMVGCALIAFFTGVMRQLAGMLALAIGCIVGWYLFNYGGDLPWVSELDGRYLFAMSTGCGAVTFLALRVLVQWVFSFAVIAAFFGKFFGKSEGRGILGSIISLVPSSFLVMVSAVVLKLGGNIDSIEKTQEAVMAHEGTEATQESWISKAATWVKESNFSSLIASVEPADIDLVEKLGRILLLTQDSEAYQLMEKDPAMKKLLFHDDVLHYARGAQDREILQFDRASDLLKDEELRKLAANEEVAVLLTDVDLDKLEHSLLYQAPSKGEPVVRKARQETF